MNRRTFIRRVAAAVATSAIAAEPDAPRDRLGSRLPLRELGPGGPRITWLGLGGFHLGWTTERLADATLDAALECGIRYFDTAESYGPSRSEERMGRRLAPWRDLLFLASKTTATTASEARLHLEGSLRRLKCDYLDLWQLHAVSEPGEIDRRLSGGVLEFALQAREEGRIRQIGCTGHADPAALLHLLNHPSVPPRALGACMFPVNPVDGGSPAGFIARVLPVALKRGIGVLAMKSLADGRFFADKFELGRKVWATSDPLVPGALSLSECIRFVLSLPVATLVIGAEKPEYVYDKVALAKGFLHLDAAGRSECSARVSRFTVDGQVEYYKTRTASPGI
jgi:aryl-alcohol dehydrogenase-like predicted oxidoreductase